MSPAQRRRIRRRYGRHGHNKLFLALAVLLAGVLLAVLSAVGYVVSLAASSPPLSSLKPRDPGSFSIVFARDGQRLGVIQANELRKPVASSEIPQVMKDATVAIEDERFYRHKGIDYPGVIRAAVKNLSSGKTVEGGSTITMQLVRNLYITRERTYARKIREAKLAEELENEHPGPQGKDWILTEYLNTVPYGTVGGQSAIGIWAAARMYFDKSPQDLDLDEAALLAGLPQAPSLYSPLRSPKAARGRRNEVLDAMAANRFITRARAEEAKARPLDTNPGRYFQARREKFFFDYVKDQLFEALGPAAVRKGGLRIRTTIDLDLQQAARAAIANRLAGVGPSAAIVTVNPRNGQILAMASSASYSDSKFNLAAQGKRQPGSAFKTMALMTALNRGVSPTGVSYVSKPLKFRDPIWGPIDVKTYDNSYGGSLDLVRATLRSDNSVYTQLALDLGPREIKRTAHRMGITSKLEGLPAETLGGLKVGVSPLEMANAYATIASGGYRNRPIAITSIRTRGGEVLSGDDLPSRLRPKRVKVFPDGVTHEATKILEQNVQAGTGTAAQVGCAAGGKTGTTDRHSDAWFVGFTPRLATSVWVGYPKAQIYMTTEYHGGPVAGGTYPAEIWGDYMRTAKGRFCGGFPTPKEPFVSRPFFGRYASGRVSTGSGYVPNSQSAPQYAPPTAPPATSPPSTGNGGGNGNGNGNGGNGNGNGNGGGEFNPDLYEAPPQPPPDTPGGGGGGTPAPDGDG